MITHRLIAIQRNIEQACNKVGRDPASVRLLAVSKTFDAKAISEAKSLGICYFGENRVQEARDKVRAGVFEGATLCLIGHLQSNKASMAARIFDEVHSVDSPKIAQACPSSL